MLRDDRNHPTRLALTLQVWAVDISGYPPSTSNPQSSSIGNPSLEESVTHLLDRAGASGSGKQEATNVRKFLREVDRKRALVSKLLPRLMFLSYHKECTWSNMRFETTKEGRPFLAHPGLENSVDFNLTHDASWVILAFHLPTQESSSSTFISTSTSSTSRDRDQTLIQSPTSSLSPANTSQNQFRDTSLVRVGVDVMRISLPHFEESSRTFAETMEMTLTSEERAWVLAPYNDKTSTTSSQSQGKGEGLEVDSTEKWKSLETLSRLYDLWTHKEAFTKNIGKGLGFDFTLVQLELWRCRRQSSNTNASTDERESTTTSIDGKESRDENSERDSSFSMGTYQLQDLTESESFALERSSRSSSIPSSTTSSSDQETVLKIKGNSEPLYDFTEIILPDGQVRDDSQGKIGSSEREWVASQCVIAEGPMLKTEVEQRKQIEKAWSAKEAVESGLLQIWRMEEIVEKAWKVTREENGEQS